MPQDATFDPAESLMISHATEPISASGLSLTPVALLDALAVWIGDQVMPLRSKAVVVLGSRMRCKCGSLWFAHL